MSASHPKSFNIFPNRAHWDENGVFHSAPKRPPICSCHHEISPPSNLCEKCQLIRLHHLIFCEAESWRVDLGRLDAMIKRPDCDFCSLVVLGCKQTLGSTSWAEALVSTGTTWRISGGDIHMQRSQGYVLQIMGVWSSEPGHDIVLDILLKRGGLLSPVVQRSTKAYHKVDFGVLKSMFRDCEDNHESHHDAISNAPINGLYVINIKEMRVVAASTNTSRRYCALSYVWGPPSTNWLVHTRENSASLLEKNSLLNENVPLTIRDAMQVCSEIGETYLWVDSLCIVQDDPINQKLQIDAMDFIYAQAVVTIVAAAGCHADSGLPGVSTWLRDTKRQIISLQGIEASNALPRMENIVNRSIWNTRGWTYQERMFSRRCIIFTESQSYYACSVGVQYENKDRLLPIYPERFTNSWNPYNSAGPLKVFSQNVTDYTLRALTSQSDILRAFQGVMRSMMRSYNLNVHFGLPDRFFEDALLWQKAGCAEMRIADIPLPSWSWASINGAIKYTFQEEKITSPILATLPAYWQDGKEPSTFPIKWLLNSDGFNIVTINNTVPAARFEISDNQIPLTPYQIALQKPGRLLFATQHTYMHLLNSVPFTTQDTWWTDYTTDVDLSTISMVSILLPNSDSDNIAGYMEIDKVWAEQSLRLENKKKKWDFIAISLASSRMDDIMHRHFTQMRSINHPLVWSRNVGQLVVNVMLIEWEGDVATRIGIGKVFLDMWEKSQAQTKWIVLG